MYENGTLVVYGLHGVCTVLEQEKRMVDRKQVTYLVLEPVGQDGSRYYVPMHNENALAKLRSLPDRVAMESVLSSEAVRTDAWIPDENRRKQRYRELMAGCDQTAVMAMVRSLYLQKQQLAATGKKFHICDENFLRDAEKLICSELAVVMDADFEGAKRYFKQMMLEN